MRRFDGGRRGFTIGELAVVVAIIGILSALAIGEYQRTLPHRRLKADAIDLAVTMKYARLTALRVNADVGVYLDVSNGKYSLFVDRINSGYFDRTGDDIIPSKKDMRLRPGIAFNPQHSKWTVNEKNVVIFRPNGTANTDSGTAVLSNRDGEIRTVVVSPFTGRIRIGS